MHVTTQDVFKLLFLMEGINKGNINYWTKNRRLYLIDVGKMIVVYVDGLDFLFKLVKVVA